MGLLERVAGMLVPAVPALQMAAPQVDRTLEGVIVGSEEEARILRVLDASQSALGRQLFTTIINGVYPRRGTAELTLAYDRLPHLRSVVGRIAQAVAQVPWRVYRVKNRAQRRALTKGVRTSRVAAREKLAKADPDALEELDDHALARLLERYNPEMSGIAGRKLQQIHLDIPGTSYAIIERSISSGKPGYSTGEPRELWPVPPHLVRQPQGMAGPFEVIYRGNRIEVARENMFMCREHDPFDPLGVGAGIGASLADELDADEFAAKHLKTWFLNHGIPAYLVGVKDAGPDEVAVANLDWVEKNKGPLKNNRVHFHNGDLEAVRLDDTFADMQVVELRRFAMEVVRETYNVPPELVGHLDSSNRATIEEALAIMAVLVVQPRLELMRSEIQAQLVPMFADGESIVVEYDDPIPPDHKRQLEAMKGADWAASMNEWRAMQGLEPVDKGDTLHLVNEALVDLESGDTNDVITLNELTLGIERLGAIGDIDGVNALRNALGSRLGVTLKPADAVGLDPAAGEEPDPKEQEEADEKAATERLRGAASKLFFRKAVDAKEIDEIVSAINPDTLARALRPEYGFTLTEFGSGMAQELSGPAFDGAEAERNYLAQIAGRRIRGINSTTRSKIRKLLVDLVDEGASTAEIAQAIADEFDKMSQGRARTIAVSEVGSAANWARWQAMVSADIPFKRWGTQQDSRVRRPHAAMSGQTKPINRAFQAPSGAKAMHPGGFPSAVLNVNCRCFVIPVRDPTKAIDEVVLWRAYDRQAARREATFKSAVATAFREQKAAVLRRINRVG